MRHAFLFACFVLLAAGPARAQVDTEALRYWGGTYLSDCANPKSPALVIAENSIVVYLDGGKQVASKNASGSPSWYGQNAPENYIMTFTGDAAGDQILVDIFQADGETWARVDGGAPVRKLLGKAALGRRYLRCEKPALQTNPFAPAEAAKPDTAATLPSAADYAMDLAFAVPYRKALGKYAGEHWLQTLQGPSPKTKKVVIAGTEYVVIAACRDDVCADNNTTLLGNQDKKTVFGKVRVLGKSALIGNPPKEVQKDLGDLWWKQWGQNPD